MAAISTPEPRSLRLIPESRMPLHELTEQSLRKLIQQQEYLGDDQALEPKMPSKHLPRREKTGGGLEK